MKSLNPIAMAIALAPVAAFASTETPRFDDQLKLQNTVITASRVAEQRSDTYSAVSVFTRADIERLQANTVADLLRRTPGVQIIQNGGRGSTTGVFVRGTKTAQTLVLIDGQRVNDSNLGGAYLSTLSMDQIERVEVLRGPRAAIYGSDAIGGVIQIFTRRAQGEGLTPRVRMAYGSNNTWEQSVGISGGDADTRFNLSLNHEKSDGFSRNSKKTGTDADDDGFDNRSIALNLNHRFSASTEAGLNIQHTDSDYDYDGFGGGAYPYDEVRNSYYSAYINSQLNDIWTTRVEAGFSESQLENFDKSTTTKSFNESERESLNWLNTLQLTDNHRLQIGLDWYEDHIENSGDYTEDSRYNAAAFIQHSYEGDYFGTELGVRHDKNQQFGHENSFNGAFKLPVGAANELILSYAEGFRAPLLSDLYYPVDCFPGWGCSGGNPDLKPETSKTYELRWLSDSIGSVHVESAFYRTELKDAIDGWSPQNIASARMDGFELSASADLLGWQNQLSLSLLRAKDRDTDLDLQNRARRTLSWDIDRSFGEFAVGASWLAYSQAYANAANTVTVPGYGLVGVRASWQVLPELEIAGKIDNLLDKDYFSTTAFNGVPYQEDGVSAQIAFTWTPSL